MNKGVNMDNKLQELINDIKKEDAKQQLTSNELKRLQALYPRLFLT